MALLDYPAGTNCHLPTRWTLKQSWAWADMEIKDDQGNSVFRAESKLIYKDLDFYDIRTGQRICRIKRRLKFCGLPKWLILLEDGTGGYIEVKQRMTLLRPRLEIRTRDGPMEISGDWTLHSYVLSRGNRVVATVEKKWISLRDSYIVEIQPGENVIALLACCIVIDKCYTKN